MRSTTASPKNSREPGSQPFVCEHCGGAFSQNCNLTGHLSAHTVSRSSFGKECGGAFSKEGKLTRQLRTHTGSQLLMKDF